MNLNIHNADTTAVDDAIGAIISAHQDREYGRAVALGTILGFTKFHLTQKQLDALAAALTKVADAAAAYENNTAIAKEAA